MMNYLKTAFLSAGLVMAAGTLQAQESESQLDTIVVTADRVGESLRDVSQNMTIITEQEIIKSGAEDVYDLLKREGIQVFSQGAENYGNTGIVMRGSKSSMHGFDLGGDVLMLLDGRRTASDFLSGFDVNNVARIEIIRGPGAVQYGSAAMGGVVNVISKRGGKETEAMVEVGVGSWSAQRYKVGFSGQKDKMDFAASASYFTRDNYETAHGDYTYNDEKKVNANGTTFANSDLGSNIKYGFNLGWNFNEDNRLGLLFQGAEINDAGKGPTDFSDSKTVGYTDSRQDRNLHTFDLAYEGKTPDQSKTWMARYFQGKTEYNISRDYTGSTIIAQGDGGRQNMSESSNEYQGAQAQVGWKLDRFSFVTGVDWMSYDYNQVQKVRYPTISQSDLGNIGAFLLAKVHLLEDHNLVLSAGVRYDEFDLKVKGQSDATVYKYDINKKLDHVTPSIGLAYNPTSWLKLRTNWAEAFKMPLPRQLGGFTYMRSTPFVGNPDLKPEESSTWDLGFDLAYESFFMSATYFKTDYTSLIVYDTIEDDPNNTYNDGKKYNWYTNLNEATISGLELGANFDLGNHFMWNFSLEPYVYWTHLLKFEGEDGLKLQDVAQDTLSYGVQFDHEDFGLIMNLDATYYGSQIFDYDEGSIPGVDDQPAILMGGATVWDFNLTKSLPFEEQGELRLKVNIDNIFNKFYETDEDFYQPGRSFYVGLAYHY